MAEYDVLIKNGTIVDGLRTPAYRGDIAIRDGKIVAMGNIKGDTTRAIDATGCIVAPGFMDIHTHYDAALTGWDPYATLSGWHGVTSVAIGNCGFGFAPVRPEDPGAGHATHGAHRDHPVVDYAGVDALGLGDLPRVSGQPGTQQDGSECRLAGALLAAACLGDGQ